MGLRSRAFAGDTALEACLLRDQAHITPGARGPHVEKIQGFVMFLDGATIEQTELLARHYGPSTAAAVLAFKTKRRIINTSYQTRADDIVGKMTIKALDDELESRQQATHPKPARPCCADGPPAPGTLHIVRHFAARRNRAS